MLALPVILAAHSYEHFEKKDLIHNHESELSNVEDNCILFHVYHNQLSVEIDTRLPEIAENFIVVIISSEEASFLPITELLHLRGPPTA